MTSRRATGFTLSELLVYLVIAGFVMTAAYRLMVTQSRAFSKQREVVDVRETQRSAAALLAWDIRHAATGGGRVAAMNPNAIVLHSIQGHGIVCGRHPTLPRIALWKTEGTIAATASDSALMYSVGWDQWRQVKINQVGSPAAMGVPTCQLPGNPTPDIVVQITVARRQDTSRVIVGAPFRTFRRTEYAEYALNGRWWLGRRVGGVLEYEQLTGPLLAPASGGLAFTYYDTLGAVTANPAALGSVGITLRAQSFKRTHFAGTPTYSADSLTTRVALRR